MQNSSNKLPNRTVWITAIGVVFVIAAAIFIWRYYGGIQSNAHHKAFSTYVSGYTGGIISKNSPIRVQLATETNSVQTIGEPDSRKLFRFSPQVKGEVIWLDARTVEFRPANSLDPGKQYQVAFDLKQVVDIPQELSSFNFDFKVIEPSFQIEIDGLKSQNNTSLDLMQLTGKLKLADDENIELVEKIVSAQYLGKKRVISWAHQPEQRIATFTIDSIPKQEKETPLTLEWNGGSIASKKKDKTTLSIPALNDFKVLDIRAVQAPQQYVLIQFSDPLLVAQNLDGLIELQGQVYSRFSILGSEVQLYSDERLENNYTLNVYPGIENINNQKTTQQQSANIFFENRLPAVSIPGKGTILPGTGKLTMPFEAVNLKAVDVTIIRIFESNVPQYFQTNYDSNYELRRVGKPIVQKMIALGEDKSLDLTKRNRFSLDVDQLIKAEPGAIYRVLIGFRQSYSIYPCTDEQSAEAEEDGYYDPYYYLDGIDEEDEFWAGYNNYYPYNYDWEERDNPCHSSYYTTQRWASRDLMASNIGLITKRGNDNSVNVFATDMLTTQPMEGVLIKLLDYQQQVIQSGTTDKQGKVSFDDTSKPFLLVAAKGDERGYLKMDDGSALPLSRFDVGGDVVQKGIKGFIYTERGVWRPGDSLYVGFILEEKSTKLPQGHPVTLELTDARGQLYKRMVQTDGVNGFYTFKTATSTTSPTGNWLAKITVGGATFQRILKIETVMPNRLKIDLDFSGKKFLDGTSNQPIILRGSWLFGSTAKNLKARVETILTRGQTSFEGYKGYRFDDPTREYATESQVLFDGELNAEGMARITNKISASNLAPGMLNANFTTRIFEPGGNFSIDNISIPFSPYARYVGVKIPQGDRLSGMLLTDQDHEIQIAIVDQQGKALAGRQNVQVEFYKIRWNWWWNQEGDYLGNFTQDRYNQLLQKETIALENGKGTWKLRVNYPDWGRYLVRVVDPQGGHSSGSTLYIDWPGWAKREQLNNPTEASMLSFTADKDTYRLGETVTLTVPTSSEGRALISIENGSRVLQHDWINTESGQTTYKFKVTEDMAPNIFVNITLLQPHAQTANDLPIRMYGLIPLKIENPQTILKPQITMANVLRPESSSKITVSEASGKPMTYTIAIVDEGLLDLTRFQTPDPHRSFYAREALGVKTWDLFDNVLGAWGGELERILSIGGDADINRNIQPTKANRFHPVVKFMGPYTLKKGAKNNHQFELPQYVGSVRTMVIAGQDGAYGFAEKAVAVKQPLMLLATLPRMIGPDESFDLPLTVFAMESGIRNVSVELTSASSNLNIQTPKQSIRFDQEGEQLVNFKVKTTGATGVGKLKAVATSGNHTATYEVEIDIRNPNPFITDVESHEVAGGSTWTNTISPLGNSQNETISMEVSALPAINMQTHLGYLIRYPHGCLEQVTSGIFPQLFLDGLTKLTDQKRKEIERNVNAGINRVRGYTLPSGGFAYWPGASSADEWSTNYVGHMLLEAKSKGYTVPDNLLDNWKKYQRDMARKWTPNQYNWRGGDLVQAYRLYVLALAESPEMGAMNRLKEFQYLSDEAAWRLAAAYQLAGQAVVAGQLIKGRSYTSSEYTRAGNTFGSTLRDQAMILESLVLMGNNSEAEKVLLAVAQGLRDQRWHSTQTTAYALLSISKYMGSNSRNTEFAYTLQGKRTEVKNDTYIYQIELNSKQANQFALENKGVSKLYIRIIKEGQLPPGQNPERTGNPNLLNMAVSYTDAHGNTLDPATLEQGMDIIAEVTLRNTGNIGTYEHVALTQIFPAGWEIMNARMTGGSGQQGSSPATYTDIRDDRVLTYFNIRQNETLKYRIQINAAYVGEYHLPAISAEAMYDNRVQAIIPGKRVRVVRAPESP